MRIRPTDTFHINFDTEEMPGKIVAVEISLRRYITSDPKKSFRIDLSCHPLYPALCEYVRNNPPKAA